MTAPEDHVLEPRPSALAIDHDKIRGPRPPAAVCRECDKTIVAVYENPYLKTLQSLGRYDGDTGGAWMMCDACLSVKQSDEAERKARVVRELVDAPYADAKRRWKDLDLARWPELTAKRAQAWLKGRDRDLYLFGPTGRGKTVLAIALANELLDARTVAGAIVFVRVPTFIRRLKAAFDADKPNDPLLEWDTYARAGLLVLDDLGAEHGTPYTRTQIENLYQERLDGGRLTIFTSNLPLAHDAASLTRAQAEGRGLPPTLSEYLGDERLPSRICGAADLLEVGGDDYRLRGWRAIRGGRK